MMKEKRTCQAPYHPFKQKWYYYDELCDPNYCTSCEHFQKTFKLLLDAVVRPQATLYGNSLIMIDRSDAHKILDEVFDAKELE